MRHRALALWFVIHMKVSVDIALTMTNVIYNEWMKSAKYHY